MCKCINLRSVRSSRLAILWPNVENHVHGHLNNFTDQLHVFADLQRKLVEF